MCWDRFLMSQRIFISYRFLLDTIGIKFDLTKLKCMILLNKNG